MSIYDDLANSNYMNKDELQRQLQQYSQIMEQSMEGSNNFEGFSQYKSGNKNMQAQDFLAMQQSNQFQNKMQQQPINYSQNTNLVPTEFNKLNQEFQFQTISNPRGFQDLQVPPSMPKQGQQPHQEEELCNFEQNQNPNYMQTQSERNCQFDDEEIVQAQHLIQQQQNTNIRTGTFAGGNGSSLGTQQFQTSENNLNLDQFKNNNNQIELLLKQLQQPTQFNPYQQNQSTFEYQQQQVSNQPTGIHQAQLNQDSSILALAQRQPLGSSNGTNNNDQSPFDGDFYFKESNYGQPVQSSNKKFALGQQMLTNEFQTRNVNATPMQNNSRLYNPYLQAETGKENQDQNIFSRNREEQQYAEAQVTSSFHHDSLDKKQTNTTNFYSKQITDQEAKKREIMQNFDDIPIKVLNKADGYQNQIEHGNEDEDQEDYTKNLIDKFEHPKWKIRMRAYKTLNDKFYNEHAKEIQRGKNQEEEENQKEEEEERVFEVYAPLMQKIICDSNLVAQYEALNCLFAYVKFAQDLKLVTFSCHTILLDKVQLNKPNFKEITLKILTQFLKKDKWQCVGPELIKRFRNRNTKTATFAMEAILEAMTQNSLPEDLSFKTIFKATSENLSHSNKDLRETAINLLQQIYRVVSDDVPTFIRNLSHLRPVQQKDIKDMLSELQKVSNPQIQLFTQQQEVHSNQNDPQALRAKLKDRETLNDDEDLLEEIPRQEVDICNLTPDNFNEIPYLTQINVKKKGMETFNIELEKVIAKRQIVTHKDYSSIFNIVIHMLEDSNALVFMEAIKTVEFLCLILGKNIKQQKLRQFITLLADKYKETKTAVVSQVNKAFTIIIQKQNLPIIHLIEYLICTVANNNKNPRVKQLILEKVDWAIKEEVNLKEEELSHIFKSISQKSINFIQKDTNAGVRDASVSLLTTFKALIPNSQQVADAVNTLPKYRVNEIIKNANELIQLRKTIKAEKQDQEKDQQREVKEKKPSKKNGQSQDFSYNGRQVSGVYQIHLADVILTLKKMKDGQFLSGSELNEKWDDFIESLNEEGIKETKPIIISCVKWLFSFFKNQEFPNFESFNCILILVKKIYCIERSVEWKEEGISQELNDAIDILLFASTQTQNIKLLEGLINVIMAASGQVLTFLDYLKDKLSWRNKNDKFNLGQTYEFIFKWLQNKLDQFILKGVSEEDYENFRSVGIQYIQSIPQSEERQELIEVLGIFKNQMNIKFKKMTQLEESGIKHHQDENDEEEKGEVSNILKSMKSSPSKYHQDEELKFSQLNHQPLKNKGQLIAEEIEQNFEKGLLMLKDLPSSQDAQDAETKRYIFEKLLQLVGNHCKNPQQQYQQAYALKALMWFKEEVMGLEDCFNYAIQVLQAYARAEFEGRDSSVELYLLNHWVKDLSLRDLIDRVSFCSSNNDQLQFLTLFQWLMNHSLNAASQETKWAIEDFRKIALLLAKNIRESVIQEFFQQAVQKFGEQRVKEFMEIQLMHSPSEFNVFVDWFQVKFTKINSYSTQNTRVDLPQIKIDQVDKTKPQYYKTSAQGFQDQELQNVVKGSSHNVCAQSNIQPEESVCSSARTKQSGMHSQLYQKLREKKKNDNQKKLDEGGENNRQYEDILNRLESQLQQVQPKKTEESQIQRQTQKPSTSSTRYDNLEKEVEEEDKISSKNLYEDSQQQDSIQKIQNCQTNLMASQIKENDYKNEMVKLEEERKRIEREREQIMREKDKQSEEWKKKYEIIRQEHEEVVENLEDANKCYLNQVSENEDLKDQLRKMQDQHIMMMRKFEELESKINKSDEKKKESKVAQITKKDQKFQIVSEENITKIESLFKDENGQVMVFQSEGEIGIKKIQDLLLTCENNVEEQIGLPLYFYYSKIKSQKEKFVMVQGLNEALNNEDVLYALSIDTYKAILNFLLKVFSMEKANLEKHSLHSSTMSKTNNEQNEITLETQKAVSKLLNSKEFTTSLVSLFQILRVSMPDDIQKELTHEQQQMLKVIMRCISRITKALHSENPDLIRAFDVLIEMQKIFVKHPPEMLREDLPSLQDYDYVYRILKDVSDKLMELQPEKVINFLKFVRDQPGNAFIKYMEQMMQSKNQDYDEADEYQYSESGNY